MGSSELMSHMCFRDGNTVRVVSYWVYCREIFHAIWCLNDDGVVDYSYEVFLNSQIVFAVMTFS